MIIQACINGARDATFHPALPLTPQAMAADCLACVLAGAGEIHLHTRDTDGRESLAPEAMDGTMRLVRVVVPGTLVGVSTGDWIEKSDARTLAAIATWQVLPDYASVNLSEPAAPAVMRQLSARGVGIEAGLASVADAERLVGLTLERPPLRILIEIAEQEFGEATRVADGIHAVLEKAGLRRPILLHGMDDTVWHFARLAAARRWSTRVGLEDGRLLPDGAPAPDNAALVRAAVEIYRQAAAQ
ncbi:3-keto-5-aminohexanoate cleavage protein [Shinella sp. CPCC 101442]|uniref:3-keto-5-aminohexanoate cleavage protein n=1 Tax=Shinella sp. CPCC 101442 TaxID=2932265 RepID=UPI002152D0F2|nr:3-keto-5-aminohexanoate cleavage protein [Shinella sp. CPCC 101442]MCR6500629.1 3-keto-5-aminohexanoate cleavage protein [Shinella sp. CPCC 101442]